MATNRVVSEYAIRLKDEVSKGSKAAGSALKALTADAKNLEKIGGYKSALRDLRPLATAYKSTQQEVKRLALEMKSGGTASSALRKEFDKAARSAQKAKAAYRDQISTVRSQASALRSAGTQVNNLASAETRLRSSIERTTAAMKKQEAAARRKSARREALGGMAAAGGVYAAHQARNIAVKAVVSAAEFDIGVRKQRAFTDISQADQDRLLIPQAKKIGQETQFTNLDVVKAQTKAMQGLPTDFSANLKAEVAHGILENVKNYALVMEADLETSSEAIRSYLLQTGKDISTKEKALAEANKATNQLVRMAKLGGMSDEDVQQYMKYAAATGTAVGLSSETLQSLAALARRGGLRGDEAGVFIRTAASKLVAPTKQGYTALNAAGINYDDYVHMPNKLETSSFENHYKRTLGTGFTDKNRAKLDKILSDPKLLQDRGAFVEAVTKTLEGQFRGKKGKTSAQDKRRIAKAAEDFHKVSAETVDSEGLLDAMLSSNMTLQQANAVLTNKHGGKFMITKKQWDDFKLAREELKKAGDDPDFVKKKADEIMGGLGGSFERLKGSVETFTQAVGESNSKWLTYTFDNVGNLIDKFAQLDGTTQQVITIVGGLGATLGGLAGTYGLFKMFTGGGASAALTGSAAALDLSAAALTQAAIALGGKGIVGGAASAGAAGAGAGAAGKGLLGKGMNLKGAAKGGLVLGGVAMAGEYLMNLGFNALPKPEYPAGYDPEAELNMGPFARLGRIWDRDLKPMFGDIGTAHQNKAQQDTKAPEGFNLGFGYDQGGYGVDTAAVDAGTTKAREAGEEIKTSLSVTAKPVIDNTSLEQTLRLVQQIANGLQGISTASTKGAGSIRNVHADVGLGIP